jgi:Ca2+-binding RTX toxin-like protein
MADIPASVKSKAVLEGDATAGSFSGQLETPGDHDWIKVSLTAGQTYNFFLSFLDTGSVINGDSVLTLRDATGAVLADADGGGVGLNSFLSYPITTSGTYFIDVHENAANNLGGDYGLFVTSIVYPLTPETNGDDEDLTAFLNKTFVGGKGADRIAAGVDACILLGEQGNDILIGRDGSDFISGGLGNDTIDAGAGNNILFGDAGNDDIFGGPDSDTLYGGAGDDHLYGGAGSDFITGGSGKDYMIGGADGDVFVFKHTTDSRPGANRDVITDFFDVGDKIDLSAIDAKTGPGNQAFKFIGTHAFHHKAGELHYRIDEPHEKVIIQGDVNGDGKADFEIELSGLQPLQPGDFNL